MSTRWLRSWWSRKSWLLRLAKLEAAPLDAAGLLILAKVAQEFLANGGTIPPADYLALGPEERAALTVASERLRAEQCAALGFAMQGQMQAALVLAPADGGQARNRVLLSRALDRMEARMGR